MHNFDFLAFTEDYNERELDKALIDHLTRSLPDNLKPSLPSIEALEAELTADDEAKEEGK